MTREQTMLHQTLYQKDKRTNNATPNTIPKRKYCATRTPLKKGGQLMCFLFL